MWFLIKKIVILNFCLVTADKHRMSPHSLATKYFHIYTVSWESLTVEVVTTIMLSYDTKRPTSVVTGLAAHWPL